MRGGGFDYKSPRWLRLREKILRRDGYLCRESLRYGVRRQAEVVHHVWPAEQFPEYAWCEWNLLSLTRVNHERMHDRDGARLSPLGEAWRRRTPPPDR